MPTHKVTMGVDYLVKQLRDWQNTLDSMAERSEHSARVNNSALSDLAGWLSQAASAIVELNRLVPDERSDADIEACEEPEQEEVPYDTLKFRTHDVDTGEVKLRRWSGVDETGEDWETPPLDMILAAVPDLYAAADRARREGRTLEISWKQVDG